MTTEREGRGPLRARINLLSSRISCCCGLDATHTKEEKKEEEGFRCWPFFFLSSLFAVCHKTFRGTLMGFGGIQSQGDYISVHHLLDFSHRIKMKLKNPFDRISI